MQLELQLGKFAERKQSTPIDLDLSCRGRMHKACCAFVACRGGARCPGCDTAQSHCCSSAPLAAGAAPSRARFPVGKMEVVCPSATRQKFLKFQK